MTERKRVRKPRDINSGGVEALCDQNGWIEASVMMTGAGVIALAEARRLHEWLGRYIAWREQKDATK